ncbi:MAG: glycogen/starch synthase [Bacteroidales bacterium]|nr:glycogen/starch synthase [Bacteroidales bacterium]
MRGTKVLYVSQEITPYLPESEMSIIGRNLPQAIQEKGREIRTFMPKFGCINERRNQLHEVIRLSGMNIIIDDTDHPLIIKVASIQAARMQVYFIDNDDYFQRKSLFGDEKTLFFDDNDERAIFFARGVLETVKKLQWPPDIIHCHGWFSALLSLYIKRLYDEDPVFKNSKVILSLYDNGFDQSLNKSFKKKLRLDGIPEADLKVVEDPSYVNYCKLAVNMSDAVIIGSQEVNADVVKYAEKSKKPVLYYQNSDSYVDAYSLFYDQVLNGSKD